MIAHLRQKSGADATLTVKKVEAGSVKLTLEGSKEDLEYIKALFEAGQLDEILGIPVLNVQISNLEYSGLNPLSAFFSLCYIITEAIASSFESKDVVKKSVEKICVQCEKRQNEEDESIFKISLSNFPQSFDCSLTDLSDYLEQRKPKSSEQIISPTGLIEEGLLSIIQQAGEGQVTLEFKGYAEDKVDFTCSVNVSSSKRYNYDVVHSRQSRRYSTLLPHQTQPSSQNDSPSPSQNDLISDYFPEIRRGIRRLKIVVNVLEETVNVLEETLEESPRLREFISEPNQWLRLWTEHVYSFRASIRDYYNIFNQPSPTPQQLSFIYNSIRSYSSQVTQYVNLVQAYCLSWLTECGADDFTQIEARINDLSETLNNLAELADVSLVQTRLLEFRDLVLTIESLLSEQAIRIPENSINLNDEQLDRYRQLVALLQTAIATWESKIALYERALNDASFSADYLLEAREEIRTFLADLNEYTRLVQKIYRNLLEL